MKKIKEFKTITDAAYADLEEAVGAENVSREPVILDGYAWQSYANNDPSKWVKRPIAVVLPRTTEEVQAVVKACNKHGIKFKAFSTGWGAWGGCTEDDVVQVDLRRMDRIVSLDAKNMCAVIEPYVCGAQLQAEAFKLGLNTNIVGAGPNCSPLAAATSAWGLGNTAIYTSFSPRNVLGFEWVTPEGEVVRGGSCGSGLDWFVGDGPGPSLRGLVRGAVGAFGGLGIFTKVALKLYNWSGPAVPKNLDGILLSVDSDVPDNLGIYLCFFPNVQAFNDANHKICDAEIGVMALRSTAAAALVTQYPHLADKILSQPVMKSFMTNTMRYLYVMMVVGSSPSDFAYQDQALRKIVKDHGGFIMHQHGNASQGARQWITLARSTSPALVFRRGGSFHTAVPRNDAMDLQSDFLEILNKKKIEEYIPQGKVIDDGGDTAYYVPFENGTWGHSEMTYQYDPNNEAHLKGLKSIHVESFLLNASMGMEPAHDNEAFARTLFSPMCCNFAEWQKKIACSFDPNDVGDKGYYTKEEEMHFEGLEPELVKKVQEIVKKYAWTEDGPPR